MDWEGARAVVRELAAGGKIGGGGSKGWGFEGRCLAVRRRERMGARREIVIVLVLSERRRKSGS